MKKILAVLLLIVFQNCDTRKKITDGLEVQLFCSVFASCSSTAVRGVKFGMIGDSWTDLLFGTNVIENMRYQLEKYHGYQITGSTLGGQTLANAVKAGLQFKVIDEAGPSIKYMLLSLGGNDLQGNPSAYAGNIAAEKARRLAQIQENLLGMVSSGNFYKLQKWGGDPLTWIIYGYDYPNPDVPSVQDSTSCRSTLKSAGFSDTDVDTLVVSTLNEYNVFLSQMITKDYHIRYIDLRGTLGGPYSQKQYMYDCIHPNSAGFRLLGNRYAETLKGFTNNER
ncbi:MAG TPA: GDSL-type esterase/lipase family protein [Leptospiraceae bacterium]|nr:GDSL-type esterase/lipase family protein [Leptospiraceae bacterium]HMY68810.1 GDSL-type esterase/lipase family protein [Leptospiraceae bacterium]HMZ59173.1 GDSL-type esterase/lipase family protein [Leptospiraceae bacterium]HNF26464.1 GDSL-type esterase/lipase family protein [Leptospiraceae bacterium]HNI25685.1 GDSL-type esterase/lipase family protein [Leptospiraceae bacterium]